MTEGEREEIMKQLKRHTDMNTERKRYKMNTCKCVFVCAVSKCEHTCSWRALWLLIGYIWASLIKDQDQSWHKPMLYVGQYVMRSRLWPPVWPWALSLPSWRCWCNVMTVRSNRQQLIKLADVLLFVRWAKTQSVTSSLQELKRFGSNFRGCIKRQITSNVQRSRRLMKDVYT